MRPSVPGTSTRCPVPAPLPGAGHSPQKSGKGNSPVPTSPPPYVPTWVLFAPALSPRASSLSGSVDNTQGIPSWLPPGDRGGGGRRQRGGPCQLSLESLLRRQDHKAAAAWPTARSLGTAGSLPCASGPDSRAFRSQGCLAARRELPVERRPASPSALGNAGLLRARGCAESRLPARSCPGGFLLRLLLFRANGSLSTTCFCGSLRGEMGAGLGAAGRIPASVGARGQRWPGPQSPGPLCAHSPVSLWPLLLTAPCSFPHSQLRPLPFVPSSQTPFFLSFIHLTNTY